MDLIRTETREIDGKSYEVAQLGAIKGSQVFVRVLKLLGPVFTSKDPAKLFEALKEEDLDYLVKAFSPRTMVIGEGQLDKIFDLHFAGKYLAMVQWLMFCVELNYGEFLKGKAGGLGAMLGAPKAPSESKSQTASTGPAGGS